MNWIPAGAEAHPDIANVTLAVAVAATGLVQRSILAPSRATCIVVAALLALVMLILALPEVAPAGRTLAMRPAS